MNKLRNTFDDILKDNRKALICYTVGGYPTINDSKEIVSTLIEAGADIIEIGIPFSDPMADGPIIQKASSYALQKGVTPTDCFSIVNESKQRFPKVPILLMTYTNIVFSNDLKKFLKEARKSNVDGLIIPDLNVEESYEYVNLTTELHLGTVFLVAPNTEKERLKKITNASTGFVYLVSVFGTTGSRSNFENYTFDAIKRTKQVTKQNNVPLAVGFGISNASDADKIIKNGADGIIVGTSLVNIIMENSDNKEKMLNELTKLVKELKKTC